MLAGEPFLYHAVIAQYLNCGLLDPLRVCREVEKAYPMKIIKLSPSERKIGLSIRAMRMDQDRADWQTYSEGASGRPQATLADHFRQQQRDEEQ